VGLMLVGHHGADQQLFVLARAIERGGKGSVERPPRPMQSTRRLVGTCRRGRDLYVYSPYLCRDMIRIHFEHTVTPGIANEATVCTNLRDSQEASAVKCGGMPEIMDDADSIATKSHCRSYNSSPHKKKYWLALLEMQAAAVKQGVPGAEGRGGIIVRKLFRWSRHSSTTTSLGAETKFVTAIRLNPDRTRTFGCSRTHIDILSIERPSPTCFPLGAPALSEPASVVARRRLSGLHTIYEHH